MPENKRDHFHVEGKGAFFQLPEEVLPEEVQGTLRDSIHHGVANIMNRAMNGPKTIEIAGYTILAMPLQSMAFTPEQKKKFEEAGGLINPVVEVATADINRDKMMYWTEDFDALRVEIDGMCYEGFGLFKKVHEAFPHICSMTKDEAINAGLYPKIHYRNHAASKWMAECMGGRLATLDRDYNGELRNMYSEAQGETNLQKFARMGQAQFGDRDFRNGQIYDLGEWVQLGSDPIDDDNHHVRTFYGHRNDETVGNIPDNKRDAISYVVIFPRIGSKTPGFQPDCNYTVR